MSTGAIAAVGLMYSMYQGEEAADDRKKAMAQADEQAKRMGYLSEEQRQWYNKMYRPIEERMIADANQDGGTSTFYRQKSEMQKGLMDMRRKIKEGDNSPYDQARLDSLDMKESEAISGLWGEDSDRKKNMKMNLMGIGRGLPGSAQMGMQSAGASMGFYGQLASIYGRQEDMANQGVASNLQAGLWAWEKSKQPPKNGTTIGSTPPPVSGTPWFNQDVTGFFGNNYGGAH